MNPSFIILLSFIISIQASLNLTSLEEQIRNTEKIIYLYKEKLQMLKNIYHEKSPNSTLTPSTFNYNFNRTSTHKKDSEKLLLIKQFNQSCYLIGNGYIINDKKIMNVENESIIGELHGQILIVEENVITTLTYNKISLTEIKNHEGIVSTSEYMIGLGALQLKSMWHRNLNIKDGQDLLIQWSQNVVYFRGKEQTNMIQLPKEQTLIQIYSLNQYKVIFVSNIRIGMINSRSLQIGQCISIRNITRFKNNSEIAIIYAFKKQHFISILLNSGQIARYYNEKIIHYSLIPKIATEFRLQTNLVYIQSLNQYIFIIFHSQNTLKIYNNRYQQIQRIRLPDNYEQRPKFHIYNERNLYKMMISNETYTQIYELLISESEEPSNHHYVFFKVFGIALVICCFIYFKWIKKDQRQGQSQIKNVSGVKKGKVNQNRKGEMPEGQLTITRTQLQKSGFSQDEIQQFLLLKSNQGLSQKQKST